MFLTTTTVMDIMYITRKSFKNNSDQKNAVQSDCAKNHFANLIITRNIKDFINSPVKAITPEDFLKQYQ